MNTFDLNERNSDVKVLYELLVYKDWKLDPEQWKSVAPYALSGDDCSHSWWWNLVRILKNFSKIPWPEDYEAKIALFLQSWQISLSHNGKYVAVLQDNILEIRASRDEYVSVIGRATIPRDRRPQFRKMCWSPDSHMIAVGFSDGSVRVYDCCGSLIFKIPLIIPENNPKKLISGLEFIRSREKKSEWELLIIYASGSIDCYVISSGDKILFSHHSILSEVGITCSAFSQEHGTLFLSMKPLNVLALESSAGLTAWRLLNEAPFYKKIIPTVDELGIRQTHGTIRKLLTFFNKKECIIKMVLSPSNEYLATLHTDGTVLIWLSPILRVYSKLDKLDTEQQNVMFMLSQNCKSSHVIDIEWRRDNKLIVGWKNGTISIHDTNSSDVLTCFGPEILEGSPRVTSAPTVHGFLVLENKTDYFARPSVSPLQDNSTDDERSILDATCELIQSTMYFLTDLEKYEPKMKLIKIVQRSFRLLGVKMTTPEELFERCLQSNEFDKAFGICNEYGLDVMKVFQRQWRTSEVSYYTIQEYLDNVEDEEWILNECLDRIPETLEGAKLLIEYSLKFTNRKLYLDELKDSNQDKFEKFILARHRFLDYSAKLQVYEQIIDENSYKMEDYEKFRKQSIVDSAIDFARSGHSTAIELLFTHHGTEILPYWLNILDNFPESVSPMDYRSLLPKCDNDGAPVIWKCINDNKNLDWCKGENYRKPEELNGKPYKRFEDIYSFNSEGISCWYKNRALTLERLSSVVDNALVLLKLGIENNVKDLEETLYELKMLCIFVYELNIDINFDHLQKQCTLKKLQFFIQKQEDFHICMLQYVHPALDHFAVKHSNEWFELYHDFLLYFSRKAFSSVLKYINNLLVGCYDLIGNYERLVRVLIDCIYAYEHLDLLKESEDLIDKVCEWLSNLSDNPCSKNKMLKSLFTVKNEIKSVYILIEHNYGRPLSYLKFSKKNFKRSKQFIEDFVSSVIKSLSLHVEDWISFLNDLIYLQRNCFFIVPAEYCYEMIVSHMLKSSSMALIENSFSILSCSKNQPQRILNFEASVRIIISASRYYFNSSSHFDDKFMQLANACLLLIEEDNEEIQEELDLIFSLKLLLELNVNILPIQVRQTTNRMKLIDICFDQNRRAYQNPEKMYKLAFKLRILRNNKRQCYNVITFRLAQEAFKAHDYIVCAEFCKMLILEQFAESWKLCMNLGACNEYNDTESKLEMINFSLMFAPARALPHLLRIREELKCKQRISDLICSLENVLIYNIAEERKKLSKLKHFISVSDRKEIMEKIPELWSDLVINELNFEEATSEFSFVYPDIYFSLHPYSHNVNCQIITSVPKEHILLCLVDIFLKIIFENYNLKDNDTNEILKKALKICGILFSEKDTSISLCFFLCLGVYSENFTLKNCFKETNFMFLMELYFIALKDLCLYSSCAFSSTPAETISTFLEKPFKDANSKLLMRLIAYSKNYNHAVQVNSLKCGIDSTRFSVDEQYKRDTILGLAISEEYGTLKSAINLAKQNNINVNEVVVSHLISLLINSSVAAINERICDDEIMSILHENSDFCLERFLSALPSLNGTDYQILISFFSLIKILKDDFCIWSLTPKEHISLLMKLKSLSKDIDYKDLLLGKDELYFILQPLMSGDKFLVVDKFIKRLPSVIKNKYEIGKFFCQWAIEEFNRKCINVPFKQAVLNFDNLTKFFAKMSEGEVHIFFESTLLSLSTVSTMDAGLRMQLVISLFTWCSSNNSGNQFGNLLPFLQKNLDILNQLWDEDYEHWNQHLKEYVFLLEECFREPNGEEGVINVLKRAILNPNIKKSDICYLHSIAQIKDPILDTITNLIDEPSNLEILSEWKKQFSESD